MTPAKKHASSNGHSRLEPLYEPLDYFVVRAPLLPIEEYLRLKSMQLSLRQSEGSANIFSQDETILSHLPWASYALATGSYSLFEELSRMPGTKRDTKRAWRKLLRYLIRMSTRPTPYGLFAGVAMAQWGNRTTLTLSAVPQSQRTRLDIEWLLKFVYRLESQLHIRRQLRLMANPAAIIRAGRVFLQQSVPLDQIEFNHAGVSIRATRVVQRALAVTSMPLPYRDVINAVLAEAPTTSEDKAERLITELWQHSLLLTDLRPPLTAMDPGRYVQQRLAEIGDADEAFLQLTALLNAMAYQDTLPPEEALLKFPHLKVQATEVLSGSSTTPFQIDMALGLNGQELSSEVGVEAARAAELLLKMTPFPTGFPHLTTYRQNFEERYGDSREVPLLELLNPDFGLGLPTTYTQVRGIRGGDESKLKNYRRGNILMQIASQALYDHQLIVELDESTLAALETCSPTNLTAPSTLELFLFVTAESTSAIDSGHFQIIIGPNVGALAAGRNLGRFASLLGSPARTLLEHSAQVTKLQAPNALCAELVYLPLRTRTANVTIRPAIYDYEVVLGVTPGISPERVIPLAELMVGVRGGRFYLHWPRMGKDVVICTSHMLNPRSGLEIARFLSELSADSQPQLHGFDWGSATGFPFLPRVQVGRIVLHLARWRIDLHLREQWLDITDFRRFVQSLQLWRKHWQVPHQVYLSQNDNRLLLDLEDEYHIEELMIEVSKISGDGAVTLQEVLPTLDHIWTEGPAGHYITEFVIPLKLRHKFTSTTQGEFSQSHSHVRTNEAAKVTLPVMTEARLRLPGSEWLFIKLYCPRVLEEDILVDHIYNFLHQVIQDNVAQGWFFVRYADPDPHLRLRFLGSPTHLQQQLLPQLADLASNLVAKGLCQRFVIDTYEREVERYGGEVSLCEVEKLFAVDSQVVIDLLRLIRIPRMQVNRTLLAVLSVDDLLAGLGFNLEERATWYTKKVGLRREAGTDYRQRKADLRRLLINPLDVFGENIGTSIMQMLEERRVALTPIGISLRQLAERGELVQDLDQLYSSIIHMHCNRLLGIDRSAEHLVLGLLLRTREGLLRSPYR